MSWLTPSVAMNELTFSFTTTNPEKKPTRAHTPIAIRAVTTPGRLKSRGATAPLRASFCNHVDTMSESEHIAPMDKSKEFVASGMRNASARRPIGTFSPSVNLNVALLRNVSDFHRPNTIMKPTHR